MLGDLLLYMPKSSLGKAKDTDGTYVTMSSMAAMLMKYGTTAFAPFSMLMPLMPLATKCW